MVAVQAKNGDPGMSPEFSRTAARRGKFSTTGMDESSRSQKAINFSVWEKRSIFSTRCGELPPVLRKIFSPSCMFATAL